MPYNTNDDLPQNVRNVLPLNALSIFREAFNNTHSSSGSEVTSFKVAWSAVTRKYEKNEATGKYHKIKENA